MLYTRDGLRVTPLELEALRSVASVNAITSEVTGAALS